MKLTREQIAALASGTAMEVVLAMSTGDNAEKIEGVEAFQAAMATAAAEKEALTTQLAAALADTETSKAELATAKSESEAAAADAATLRGIVERQVSQLSVAVGTKFDATGLSAAELVAKHAEVTTAVTDKFKNVPLAGTKPVTAAPTKPEVSPTRLAKAKLFNIVQ